MGILENKIAVITGGGRGIGKAIANQYSEQGATVIIVKLDGKIIYLILVLKSCRTYQASLHIHFLIFEQ